VLLRPTQSTGLYVQICGRGMRLAPGKTDCLVLDYGDNIARHGPITAVKPKEQKSEAKPGTKVCPACDAEVPVHRIECPECGAMFPRVARPIEHERKAAGLAIMGPAPEPEWIDVVGVSYERWDKRVKEGEPPALPTVVVKFHTGNLAKKDYRMWWCPLHGGFATEKFWRSWVRMGGVLPAPRDIDETIDRARVELRPVTAIVVEKDGQYDKIKDMRFGERVAVTDHVAEVPDEMDNMGMDADDFGVDEIWGEM
jgi:DNA repair protein RadD